MTTRTDSTGDMVSQLIRMVADLQVVVKAQGDTIAAQQEGMEEMGKVIGRLQTIGWREGAWRGECRR